MSPKSIFHPVFALVIFTAIIGLWTFFSRVFVLRRKRIRAQALADGSKWDQILQDVENPSDAFMNLFEVPVLFYAVTLAIFVTGKVSPYFVATAWVFVGLRIAQALIHCTYNQIAHRAAVFLLGFVVVISMWVQFMIRLG